MNASSVCNLTNADATQICDEIAIYRRSRNQVLNRYKIQRNETAGECEEYSLKLAWDYRLEKKIERVVARKCPTKPSLWMSDGKNVGGVYVYTKINRRKELKLIDYITFVERTNYDNP